jgi:hypothetical protein
VFFPKKKTLFLWVYIGHIPGHWPLRMCFFPPLSRCCQRSVQELFRDHHARGHSSDGLGWPGHQVGSGIQGRQRHKWFTNDDATQMMMRRSYKWWWDVDGVGTNDDET